MINAVGCECGSAVGVGDIAMTMRPSGGACFFSGVMTKLVFFCMFASMSATSASAQPVEDAFKAEINANTVTILGGGIGGTYLRFADDIATAIGDGDNLRILPMRGDGKNVRDLFYLRGVDMAMIRADEIETLRGQPHFPNLDQRLKYITVLCLEELHVWASKPEIRSVSDLQGKVVAVSGGALEAVEILLGKLGITPAKLVESRPLDAIANIENGQYDALIRFAGKPVTDLDKMSEINSQMRLVPVPYAESLSDTVYVPTTLSHDDYPMFIPEGQKVETIAVNALLAVYNWPVGSERYLRLARFTEAFFSNFSAIIDRKGRDAKWDEVNLASTLNGWQRFKPAEDWIKRQAQTTQAAQVTQAVPVRQLASTFKKILKTKSRTGPPVAKRR